MKRHAVMYLVSCAALWMAACQEQHDRRADTATCVFCGQGNTGDKGPLLASSGCGHWMHEDCAFNNDGTCPQCQRSMWPGMPLEIFLEHLGAMGVSVPSHMIQDDDARSGGAVNAAASQIFEFNAHNAATYLITEQNVEGASSTRPFETQPIVVLLNPEWLTCTNLPKSVTVTAELRINPDGAGELRGTTTVAVDSDGRARFTDLAVETSGGVAGVYALRFSTSHPFDIESIAPTFLVAPEVVVPLPTRRYISTSLYGSHPMYAHGAIVNTELARTLYPGWKVRIYHDGKQQQNVTQRLVEMGAELVDMSDFQYVPRDGSTYEHTGMFWRMFIVDDPSVDVSINVDADARLCLRQKLAVDEWLRSGLSIHTMRDSSWHNHAINGGMWGCRHKCIDNMQGRAVDFLSRRNGTYWSDMEFLISVVWREAYASSLAHDSVTCETWDDAVPFPVARKCGRDAKGDIRCDCVNRKWAEDDFPHDTAADSEWHFGDVNHQTSPLCRRRYDHYWG